MYHVYSSAGYHRLWSERKDAEADAIEQIRQWRMVGNHRVTSWVNWMGKKVWTEENMKEPLKEKEGRDNAD